jgi:FkbM family methyltransferase
MEPLHLAEKDGPRGGGVWRRVRTVFRRERRPFRYLLGLALWRTQLCRLLTIRRDGYRMRFFPTAISALYWIDHRARNEDHFFFTSYLRAGDRVVDVGANVGALTLAAALAVGEDGRVVAIEAHPRTFRYLQANVRLNRALHVELFHRAVGDAPGTIVISDGTLDDQNRVQVGSDTSGVEVPMDTLDSLLAGVLTHIDLLKIDVEGFELFALRGANELLQKIECVYFESNRALCHRYGYTPGEVLTFLEEAGFHLFLLRDGGMEPISRDFQSTDCENVIGVRSVEGLRARLAGAADLGMRGHAER